MSEILVLVEHADGHIELLTHRLPLPGAKAPPRPAELEESPTPTVAGTTEPISVASGV